MRVLQLEGRLFPDHLLFQLVSQMFSLLQLLPLFNRHLLCKETRVSSNQLVGNQIVDMRIIN